MKKDKKIMDERIKKFEKENEEYKKKITRRRK